MTPLIAVVVVVASAFVPENVLLSERMVELAAPASDVRYPAPLVKSVLLWPVRAEIARALVK